MAKKDNSGKFKTGNSLIGYVFHKKRGSGYITFSTLKEAKKRGYKK